MSKVSVLMIAPFDKYRERVSKNGFSMLEAVVVVGVLLALAVGGLFIYTDVRDSAKRATVRSAASSVYMAALSAEMDGREETTYKLVEKQYNESQEKIKVTVIVVD